MRVLHRKDTRIPSRCQLGVELRLEEARPDFVDLGGGCNVGNGYFAWRNAYHAAIATVETINVENAAAGQGVVAQYSVGVS